MSLSDNVIYSLLAESKQHGILFVTERVPTTCKRAHCKKIVLQIFLIGHSRSLFPLFSFLLMKLIVNKFGDDWI